MDNEALIEVLIYLEYCNFLCCFNYFLSNKIIICTVRLVRLLWRLVQYVVFSESKFWKHPYLSQHHKHFKWIHYDQIFYFLFLYYLDYFIIISIINYNSHYKYDLNLLESLKNTNCIDALKIK